MDFDQLDYFAHQDARVTIKLGPTVDPDNTVWSNWHLLYPQYIDSKKKRPEGRRIAIANAVEQPTIDEMGQMCCHLNLPHVLEYTKAYSRDALNPGRIRVLLKDEKSGNLYNKDIQTKKILMLKMGELIPQLKTRNMPASRSTGGPPSLSSKGTRKKKK